MKKKKNSPCIVISQFQPLSIAYGAISPHHTHTHTFTHTHSLIHSMLHEVRATKLN